VDLFKKAEKHFQPFNHNHYPQSVYRQVSVVRTNIKKNILKNTVEKFYKAKSHLKCDRQPHKFTVAILLRIKA